MRKRIRSNERAEGVKYSTFIMGALIGAGVSLLLAPQAGAELRRMLSNGSDRAKDDLLERAEAAYDKGEEVVRDAGRSAKELARQTQDFVREPGRSAL